MAARLKFLATFVALLVVLRPALADPIVLDVPGEKWQLKFDGPPLTRVEDASIATEGHVYTGNAGRFNVSLHVSEPLCEGGNSPENIYKCFGARLQRNEYILPGSIKAAKAPDGVQIGSLMVMAVEGKKYSTFNLNYVFAHDGKWGDLHVSVVSPTPDDVALIFKIIESVQIVDSPTPR